MKRLFFVLSLSGACLTATAQDSIASPQHQHALDSADIFYRHMQLNELTVTGVTGNTKLKHATGPITVVNAKDLRAIASTNIIDAISRQPGMDQLTTGCGISKPIIRGLGYNRVVVMSEGVRQEGQQWGDEHGVEVDGGSVHSVEILKGPASLMYGSDAMAGVVILHSRPILPEGELRGSFSSEYQTNNGLMGYSLTSSTATCRVRSSRRCRAGRCWGCRSSGATRASSAPCSTKRQASSRANVTRRQAI